MTTGSTVLGLVPGMDNGLEGATKATVVNVVGDPDGVVTVVKTSGVAWDGENGQHYMGKTGSTWLKLGSVA